MRDPNRPPPPETEPREPQEPDVGEQVTYDEITATVTSENPKGTSITYPVTSNSFFIKLAFTFRSSGSAAHVHRFSPQGMAQDARISLSGPSTLSLVNTVITPEPVTTTQSTQHGRSTSYSEWYIPVNLFGFGSGTITLENIAGEAGGLNPTQESIFNYEGYSRITLSGAAITVNVRRSPSVTIGGAENPIGTFLDEEINHNTFWVDFTWDLPTSASFTTSDITVSSSNTSMSISKGSLENIGTIGTSTNYRMQFTVSGTGITTITVTVIEGAVPAAGSFAESRVRTRTFEVNTFPAPVATIGDPQDSDGNAITQPISDDHPIIYIPITWDRNIGNFFTVEDLNIHATNPDLRGRVSLLATVTPGTHYLATVLLSGGGSGIFTIYTNRGSIPATATTSSSRRVPKTFSVGFAALPAPVGTQSGPATTQSGGSVLLKPDTITDVDPPILDIVLGNLDEAKMTSNVPINITVSYIFDRPVDGFTEATPNYRFIPRAVDAIAPKKIPQLGTFSGIEGNSTYQQIIEIQPDSSGKINVYVPANSARLVPTTTEGSSSEGDTYGPEPPGETTEIFYDTTIAGNPAPNVSISTPPTTYFTGPTYTTTFLWDQPIEPGTFRKSQVNVIGAEAGDLVQDSERRDLFRMQLTLPETGLGEIVISVYAHRIVSTAATGIVSRREGPTDTESETFLYNREYTSTGTVIQGASTICEITQPIETNSYLDEALVSRNYGGAFAGVSDMVYIDDPATGTQYLYCIVQQIKKKRGT